MPRIRTIKPEFWTDETMVQLGPFTRLFYIGLWNFADDYGVLPDEPYRLKLQVLPADDVDASEVIAELVAKGRLRRARTPDGKQVLVIPSFRTHQRVANPSAPSFGDPSDFEYEEASDQGTREDSIGINSPTEPSHGSTQEVEVEVGSGKGSKKRTSAPRTPYPDDFEEFWRVYPERPNQSKKAAHQAWQHRVRNGTEPSDLIGAAENYAEWCRLSQEDPSFVKHAERWLRDERDEIYREGVPPPKRAGPSRNGKRGSLQAIDDLKRLEEQHGVRGLEADRSQAPGGVPELGGPG